MTNAVVLAFYAQQHWGSRYGVIDAAHPTPHKGLDVALFKGNVDVPALHAGQVVAVAASSSVGHYVTVRRADGLFDTYCHIVPGVSVTQQVVQGSRLGRQATTQAEGGKDWLGQHTHLCLSRTISGWAVWGSVNIDPTPGVIAVLTSTAGDSGNPIDNSTPPPIRTAQQMTSMILEASGITGTPTFLLERDASGHGSARRFNGAAEYNTVTPGLDGLTTHKAGGLNPPATPADVAAANNVTTVIFGFFNFVGITIDQIAAIPPGGSIVAGGTASGGGSGPVDTTALAQAIAALLPVQNPGAVAEEVLELLKPLFDPRLVAALPSVSKP